MGVRVLPALGICALSLVAFGAAQGGDLAAPEVNVSRLPGPQSEANVAVDPSNSQVLLAGSNSVREGTMRLYASSDGGSTWTAETAYLPPKSPLETCAADPWAGIDLSGRQYFSFLRSTPCRTGRPRVYVMTRASSDARWGKPIVVATLRGARFDDKPALSVDTSSSSAHRNRVYVAWTRVSQRGVLSIVLSHSDNGGRRWSRPVRVNRTGRDVSYASVATVRDGTVYVAWDDASNFSVKIARSTDGGAHFERERTAAAFYNLTIPHCGSGLVIPAQPLTCARANPIVSVDASPGPYSGRVYVTYAQTDSNANRAAELTIFNRRLQTLAGHPLTREGVAVAPAPAGRRSDQFAPASAVDPSTGALWVCFYDTRSDRARRKAYYTCTVSLDGGKRWAKPVRAASVASDETQPGADSREYGDYQGLAVVNGVAHPIWTDSRDFPTLAEEIYTTRLTLADFRSSG